MATGPFRQIGLLKTGNEGLCLADVDGKGEGSLVVADATGKLRVFSGVRQRSEHPIASQGEPCAVTSFYADDRLPRVPAVAVAAGPHVYVYRSLRPFVRFTAPAIDIDKKEIDVWRQDSDAATTRASLRDRCTTTARACLLDHWPACPWRASSSRTTSNAVEASPSRRRTSSRVCRP